MKDFDYFLDHKFPLDEDFDPPFTRALIILKGQTWRGLLKEEVFRFQVESLEIFILSDMRATLSPAFTGKFFLAF